MLHHRLAAVAALLLAAPLAGGQTPDAGVPPAAEEPAATLPRDILTVEAQRRLAARLAPVTVPVRRRSPVPRGLVVPGGRSLEGAGWLAAPGRVVTASALAEGWPLAADDVIEYRDAGGAWRPAAVGVIDVHLGLAVLDAPGLPPPAEVGKAPPEKFLAPGRPLYRLDEHGRLQRLVVTARGEGQRAFYWWLDGGGAPLGAPLFDDAGRFVTLVGLPTPDAPARSLVLPTLAVRDLFDRGIEWLH